MPFLFILHFGLAVVMGYISKTITKNRGMEGGFWWGFWLGIIGVAIGALRNKK